MKFLSLQPQAMSTSFSKGQLTHNSSGMLSSIWILDSGGSHHMSPDSSCFTSISHLSSVPIMTTDDIPMPLAGVGYVVTPNLSLSLSKVYHISNLTLNLAFVGQLCDFGNLVTFFFAYCFVQDLRSHKLIGTCHRKGG